MFILKYVISWNVTLANATCKWHHEAVFFKVEFPRFFVSKKLIRAATQQAIEFWSATLCLVRDSVIVAVLRWTVGAVNLDFCQVINLRLERELGVRLEGFPTLRI